MTHQIRVHLAAIGHPIVGDALYGDDRMAETSICSGIFYTLRSLTFRHPDRWRVVTLEAELPGELDRVIGRLKVKV